jgi:hypothetical protein
MCTLFVLGSDARQIVSSGDPIEDAESRAQFARKYQEVHCFVREPDGSVRLYDDLRRGHIWNNPRSDRECAEGVIREGRQRRRKDGRQSFLVCGWPALLSSVLMTHTEDHWAHEKQEALRADF